MDAWAVASREHALRTELRVGDPTLCLDNAHSSLSAGLHSRMGPDGARAVGTRRSNRGGVFLPAEDSVRYRHRHLDAGHPAGISEYHPLRSTLETTADSANAFSEPLQMLRFLRP